MHPVIYYAIFLFIAKSCIQQSEVVEKMDVRDSIIHASIPGPAVVRSIVLYDSNATYNVQVPFQTIELISAKVAIFPNLGSRLQSWKYDNDSFSRIEMNSVYGVAQFFMDFDLTSGFVHPYTRNFYNKLRDADFVLYFERDSKSINEGTISYKRKKDITAKDILGQNIGFCRQWKLSEIEMHDGYVSMKKNAFGGFYLSVKKNSSNPFPEFIPIQSTQPNGSGECKIRDLNKLSSNNGGTAAIIWEAGGITYFIDIHGSIQSILEKLIEVSKHYNVDPTLGIYDAGGMAQKLKADSYYKIDVNKINKWCNANYVGAGYAYLIHQSY